MSVRRMLSWIVALAGALLVVELATGGVRPWSRAALELVPGVGERVAPGLPLGYAVGDVDPRFGIERERVEALADEARRIWEAAAGRELFRPVPGAKLTVNLVFDWRQEKLLAALEARRALDTNGQSFDRIQQAYNDESRMLQASKGTFDADVARLRERASDYTDRVTLWNASGARTPAGRAELDGLRQDLLAEQARLEERRAELNGWADRLNGLSETLNGLIATHNLEVENFNGTYVRTRDFEKGVFDGTAIRIYEFEGEADLTLTIVHELGHALGLPHVEDPRAVMNRKLALQDLADIRLAPEDLRVLRDRLREDHGGRAARQP